MPTAIFLEPSVPIPGECANQGQSCDPVGAGPWSEKPRRTQLTGTESSVPFKPKPAPFNIWVLLWDELYPPEFIS